MTTTSLNTATSAAPRVLVSQYVPTTGAAQYQAAVGTTTQITTAFVTNTDSVARTIKLIVVPAGGTAGATPPLLPTISLAAGATLELGEMFLGDGDSVWAEASSASKVGILLTGIEFSNATGGALTGIQDDAIGTTGSVSLCSVASGSHRLLLAGLRVSITAGSLVGYASYDALSMACTSGAMTKLVSANYDYGSGGAGSVHLFGYVDATSSSVQTCTPTVSKSGSTLVPIVASASLSGVASVTGAATNAPTTSSALALTATSAVGHRVFFAGGFSEPPRGFSQRIKAFDGAVSGFSNPDWLVLADALGAPSVPFTTTNSSYKAAVAIDLVPSP